MVVFELDTEDLNTIDIGVGEANTLPDGRPLPGIPTGSLENSLRGDTELLDLAFYYHEKLFGFYIPIGWETNGCGGFWNIVMQEKNIGMLGNGLRYQWSRRGSSVVFTFRKSEP